MDKITPVTPLRDILGTSAKKLETARSLVTAEDLLRFVPRRYVEAGQSGDFLDFQVGDRVVLTARVLSMTKRTMQARKGTMANAVIEDEHGRTASITFFRAYPHYNILTPGTLALFSGQLTMYRGSLQLAHPEYSLLDEEGLSIYEGGLVPLYRVVEKVPNLHISLAVKQVLDALGEMEDPLPKRIREGFGVPRLDDAYRMIHLPKDMAQVGAAQKRFRAEEAFTTQLVLAQRRLEAAKVPGTPRVAPAGGILDQFDRSLPFELTAGQREVGAAIADDLAKPTPMHRLLQGEVGSGKTLVALRAMLAVVDAGGQAALLAPTEVLAAQHASSIEKMLGPLAQRGRLAGSDGGTRVALLTGSMSTSARSQAMLDIVSGEAGIVIGTHALLQKNVEFADLGLVVVDEQHRFGVEQRAALRDKGIRPPHELVMTATPIPRTVAMTRFGDLDVSTMRELPKGRAPIVSHVVPASSEAWMNRLWERIAEECAAGRQAYVVAGRIGDDADAQTKNAVVSRGPRSDEAAFEDGALLDDAALTPEGSEGVVRPIGVLELKDMMETLPALKGRSIGLMHGRLPADEKDAVMAAFSSGELDILVATTVIEVGVDVPNASMIVVMDADRFGLSQLHQLRGRVGRGAHGGLCLFVTRSTDDDARSRLTKLAETQDGFAIADLDLELRREGDVLGAAQSGRGTSLQWLQLTRNSDLELLDAARKMSVELIGEDPQLANHPALARVVSERVDESKAEFLERG